MKFAKENASKLHFWSFCFLVVLSWFRYLSSGNLQVDEVTLVSPFGIAISILFTGFALVHFMAFYYLDLSIQFQFKNALFLNLVGIFMLPCISNDIFSWFAYADSFQFTDEIYSTPISRNSSFYQYVSELYKTIPNVYGIICLIVAKICIVAPSPLLNILSIKFFLALILSVVLYMFKKTNYEDESNLNFIFLNPLWTIQALGQSHTEVLGLFFIFLAIYFLKVRKFLISIIFFSMAVLVKISFVFLFPVLVWFLWKEKIEKKQFVRFSVWTAIVAFFSMLIIVVLFKDLDVLLLPLATIDKLWPTGNFCDYIVSIYRLTFQDFIGLIPAVKFGLKILFIIYIGILLWINKSIKIKMQWLEVIYFVLLAFLFLYSHRFLTWYLLLLLPLFLWLKDERLRHVFFFLSLFFTLQDIAHFNHLSYYHFAVLIIGIGGSVLFQIKSLSQPFFDRDKSHQQ